LDQLVLGLFFPRAGYELSEGLIQKTRTLQSKADIIDLATQFLKFLGLLFHPISSELF
jgi:hypothetical protein